MNRRGFIKNATYSCIAIGILPITGCSGYKVINAEKENGQIKVKRSIFLENKWVVVKPTQSYSPIYIEKTGDDVFNAVLMVCTHMQCELKPKENRFSCPCHGSEFYLDGKVKKGPAARNLTTCSTQADENFIYIHLPEE